MLTGNLAFALLAVVMFAEGLIFRNVGIKELQWVLRNDAVRDDLVVSDDVSEGESVETVLGVRLHRDEFGLSCGTTRQPQQTEHD